MGEGIFNTRQPGATLASCFSVKEATLSRSIRAQETPRQIWDCLEQLAIVTQVLANFKSNNILEKAAKASVSIDCHEEGEPDTYTVSESVNNECEKDLTSLDTYISKDTMTSYQILEGRFARSTHSFVTEGWVFCGYCSPESTIGLQTAHLATRLVTIQALKNRYRCNLNPTCEFLDFLRLQTNYGFAKKDFYHSCGRELVHSVSIEEFCQAMWFIKRNSVSIDQVLRERALDISKSQLQKILIFIHKFESYIDHILSQEHNRPYDLLTVTSIQKSKKSSGGYRAQKKIPGCAYAAANI